MSEIENIELVTDLKYKIGDIVYFFNMIDSESGYLCRCKITALFPSLLGGAKDDNLYILDFIDINNKKDRSLYNFAKDNSFARESDLSSSQEEGLIAAFKRIDKEWGEGP